MRRVVSVAAGLARKPLDACRVLDLACQEGCYAIEAALGGATCVGVEARPAHVANADALARTLAVQDRVRFETGDIRAIDRATHGGFDIVFLLGILYHLDAADAVATVKRLGAMCDDAMIIDTHIARAAKASFVADGVTYEGGYVREHDDGDGEAARAARMQASIDNTFAFYFTKTSLVRLLQEAGFGIVLEVHAPLDATKPADRLTLAALKRPVRDVATYPWINGLSETAIAARAASVLPPEPGGLRIKLANFANKALHPLGFTLARR